MPDDEPLIETDESSRRSFMKKSAIATGGLALGSGAVTSGAAQQGGQQGGTALMFGTDYVPGAPFQVIGHLESTLTLNLLQADQQNAIPSPGNYNGYVVNYTYTDIPSYTFLFSTDSLETGQTMMLGENANYFVGELNMIESNLSQTGGGGGGQ